jgi:hypothetical protein
LALVETHFLLKLLLLHAFFFKLDSHTKQLEVFLAALIV